ncbi:unnamed protein product [Prunus armeniaca]
MVAEIVGNDDEIFEEKLELSRALSGATLVFDQINWVGQVEGSHTLGTFAFEDLWMLAGGQKQDKIIVDQEQ